MIIDEARKWLGVRGGSVEHKRLIDRYNTLSPLPRGYRVRYTDDWCMTFVSVCAMDAGIKDFEYECGCQRAYLRATAEGTARNTREYRPNDVVFFAYNLPASTWRSHVGIVESVRDGRVYLIEGNNGNTVKRTSYAVDHPKLYGVIRHDATTDNVAHDYDNVVREVISGRWGNEPLRKIRLEEAGYDYAKIKAMVNDWYNKKFVGHAPDDIFAIAQEVRMGKWGNQPMREKRLVQAGYNYQEIRAEVNRQEREGVSL